MLQVQENDSLLLDISEVKKMLHIGNNAVYTFLKNEQIPTLKIGKKIKVYRAGLYEWINKNLEQSIAI